MDDETIRHASASDEPLQELSASVLTHRLSALESAIAERDASIAALTVICFELREDVKALQRVQDDEPLPPGDWQNLKFAAYRLGVSVECCRQWCATGKIDSIKRQGKWLVRIDCDFARRRLRGAA
jgi:hypothetical protein